MVKSSHYRRADRVGGLIKAEISDILMTKLSPVKSKKGFITVTGVDVSDNLKSAKIYVSILEKGKLQDEIFSNIKKATAFIRGELGKRVRLKYIPELIFKIDESIDYAFHIYELIEEIKKEGNNNEPRED
ncbi:MAG: 30S ribosome-binding factor RbfA [Nitrospirota bacterium]